MADPTYNVHEGTHTIDFPDGTRLELLRDPLGEMNGQRVL